LRKVIPFWDRLRQEVKRGKAFSPFRRVCAFGFELSISWQLFPCGEERQGVQVLHEYSL